MDKVKDAPDFDELSRKLTSEKEARATCQRQVERLEKQRRQIEQESTQMLQKREKLRDELNELQRDQVWDFDFGVKFIMIFGMVHS